MTAPVKFIFLLCMAIGIFILMQVLLPLVSFKLWELKNLTTQYSLQSPEVDSRLVLGVSVENKDNFPAFISTLKRPTSATYDTFILSVPSLKIDLQEVFVDNNDLAKGLVHLPGSALPGERGNVFISGHSALPQLFGGTKKAVFTNLLQLKKRDEIIMDVSGTKFKYQVTDIKVVGPEDLSVIMPPDEEGRYVTLMTCVPPGLNTKRLVVLGKMT